MEKYLITIHVSDWFYNNVKGNLEYAIEDNKTEDIKYYTEMLADLDEFNKNKVYVSTLKEYFQLLSKISEYTDGEYRIYNCGTWIVMGE